MFNVTQKTAPCWTDCSRQSEAEGGTEFAPVVLLVWTVSLQHRGREVTGDFYDIVDMCVLD